jgi:hypothetical protein
MSRAREQEKAEQRRIAGAYEDWSSMERQEQQGRTGAVEDRRSRSGRVRRPGRDREGNSTVSNNPTVGGLEIRRLRNLRSDGENEKK